MFCESCVPEADYPFSFILITVIGPWNAPSEECTAFYEHSLRRPAGVFLLWSPQTVYMHASIKLCLSPWLPIIYAHFLWCYMSYFSHLMLWIGLWSQRRLEGMASHG